MKINIAKLVRKENYSEEINLTYQEKNFDYGEETIEFTKPVELKGFLTTTGDIINLNCKLETELLLTCSRCLENFTYELCIDLCEKLTTNPDDKDDEVIFIDSDTIDITEIIENNIILALPVKRLCKEDCKGLCLRCGSNLNFTTCNCDKDNTDPRLSKLKDLFSRD